MIDVYPLEKNLYIYIVECIYTIGRVVVVVVVVKVEFKQYSSVKVSCGTSIRLCIYTSYYCVIVPIYCSTIAAKSSYNLGVYIMKN